MDHEHFSAPTSSAITLTTPPAHLIPGCDGYAHQDGVCETVFDCLTLGGQANALNVTVNADGVKPVELAVWQDWDGDLLRTHDPAEAAAFADRLRAFASAIDKGAALLARESNSPATPDPSVDYAARFAALDEYRLFAMEDSTGDGTAARDFVESLLLVLADWRPRIVALLADAPAWSVPEVAAYERAVNRTQEAWLLYSFRWQGGPDLPETFDLPEPAGQRIFVDADKNVAPVARIVSAGRRDLVLRGVAA